MNERIETLAKVAGYDMINKAAMRALGFDVEKFAELIVRECADVLIENGNKQFNIRTVEPESHNKTTDWMEGYEEAVKNYGSFLLKKNAKLIKKHFGVEK